MTLLTILEYPDARLKRIASPVTEFTPAIKKLVDDMAHTMYGAPGIGLAATQVDVHKRVIVIDFSEGKNDLKVFINPEMVGFARNFALPKNMTMSSTRRSHQDTEC